MISKEKIAAGDYIPNERFRNLVLKCIDNGELDGWTDLAVRVKGDDKATTALQRALGYKSHSKKHPGHVPQPTTLINYDTAVKIVLALNRDPVDYDV